MVSRSAQSSLRQAAREVPNGRVAIALAVIASLALIAILFPWYPGGQQLEVGVRVDDDIVAPGDVSYESVVLTEQRRQAAAEAISDVLILDTEIRDSQLSELRRILTAIEDERNDPTKSASAKETAVQAIPGTDLTPEAAAALVRASADRWEAMASEASDALSRTLTSAIGPSEVESAHERAVRLLPASFAAEEQAAVADLLRPLVVPTLAVSEERTQTLRDEARANTPPVRVSYATGEVIVPAGTVIDDAAFEAIQQLDVRTGTVTIPAVASAAIASVLAGAAFGGHLWVVKPRSLRGARRLALYLLTFLVPAAVAKFAFPAIFPDQDNLYLAQALPLGAAGG